METFSAKQFLDLPKEFLSCPQCSCSFPETSIGKRLSYSLDFEDPTKDLRGEIKRFLRQ